MREYRFSLTRIFPWKIHVRETCILAYFTVFETMIGLINPNPYILWLNKKILPEVYSEPSQTSKMALFVKIQRRHSELFLKIGVTKK